MSVVGLQPVSASALLSAWVVRPVVLAAAALMIGGYAWLVFRLGRRGVRWPRRRWAAFLLGVALFGWATGGVLQVYAGSLLWVWVTQMLVLLLVVPILLLAGRPAALAGEFSASTRRIGGTRLRGWVISPLVGPALLPILCGVLFFGSVPGWAIGNWVVGGLLPLAVVVAGMLVVAPLVAIQDTRASLAVGLAVAVGVAELLLDAIPGIVLRLQTKPASTYFLHRLPHAWSPTPLHDQQFAGGVLWTVAEVLDLPFLILLFLVWIRADAREAADIDAALDAERNARAAASATPIVGAPTLGPADTPWWLTDPQLRDRYRDQT